MRTGAVLLPGALAAAVWLATADGVELPWLLLGARFEADPTGRVFLLLAAVAWTAAGLALGPALREAGVRGRRLGAFASVAFIGNLGAAVAQDAVTFVACFAPMSLATYGLIAARGDGTARRAGRVYIAMAILAEAALLTGMVLAVRAAGDPDLAAVREALADAPDRDVVIGLLLVGFGVKAGALGLHLWLPLAYTASPLPVAAALAGALTELGVLGWLRVLPIGAAPLEGWGVALVVAGLAAAAYAVVVGVTQSAATAVLAYSSIAQIGLMTAGLGVALARPEAAAAATAAVLLLALHHGIAKGALLIGVGVVAGGADRGSRWAARGALLLLALALAGAPVTGGGAAKEALKSSGETLWGGMGLALALAAAGTALLMVRVLQIVVRPRPVVERLPGAGPAAGLALGVAGTAAVPLLAAAWGPFADAAPPAPSLGGAWASLWPLAAGAVGAMALGRLATARPGSRVRVPTGDVVIAAERAGARVHRVTRAAAGAAGGGADRVRARIAELDSGPAWRCAASLESRASALAVAALALAVVVLGIVLAAL